MTTYATALPFPVSPGQQFIELNAPSPDYPSHFIAGHRYFKNYDGQVFCEEQYVGQLLAEGCTVPAHVEFSAPAAVEEPTGEIVYQPMMSSWETPAVEAAPAQE